MGYDARGSSQPTKEAQSEERSTRYDTGARTTTARTRSNSTIGINRNRSKIINHESNQLLDQHGAITDPPVSEQTSRRFQVALKGWLINCAVMIAIA